MIENFMVRVLYDKKIKISNNDIMRELYNENILW